MSNESSGKKALKAGMGYTVGNMLVKGLSFLSIPVFARLLTIPDYGIYNTFASYVSILSVIIGFALHSSIKNARFDFPDLLGDYCSSVTIMVLLNTAFLGILACLFAGPLAQLLRLDQPFLVILIVLESFGMSMISFYNCYLSVDFRYKEYLILSLIYALCGIFLSVVLILTVFDEQRYMGRVLGTMLPATVLGIFLVIQIFRKVRPRYSKEYWSYGLKISLPIVPHGLSQLLLAQFDRIMINNTIGSTEAGLYSFAYNVGVIFQVVTNSLDTAWIPWFFEKMERKDYGSIRKVANIYTIFVSLGATALMLVSPEIITVLGTAKYFPSRYVGIPIVLAMFYAFLYTLPSSVEYFYKKTYLIAIGTMSAALVNIVLNAVFIPRYGYIAAAYTTVVCYLLYYAIHVCFSRRVHGSMIYDMRCQLLCLIAVTVIAFAVLAVIDLFWIRWGVLLAGMLVGGIWVYRHRNMVISGIKDFRNKS